MPQAKKLLEIFKPGTFVSVEGAKLTFSASDVAATVAAYDVAKHKAPLVIGHPRIDDPAYGHAVSLSLSSNNVVLAEPANVEPAFADAVNNERYDSISASFWSPTNPRNPVPGVFYLRHIGFLGAVPPAVPGLKQPSFADADDADLITINFADSQEPIMGTPTQAELDKQKQQLEQDQASFADQQAEAKKREDELSAREKSLAAKETKAREDEINSFAESLIKSGKLLPVEKTGMVALLSALPVEQEVSFADGDGKTVSQPSADVLRNFLTNLPPRVDFAEHSAREGEDAEGTTSFASPNGFAVDSNRMELHNKINAHAAKHNISYEQAALAVGG
jgi:hypothetical protein